MTITGVLEFYKKLTPHFTGHHLIRLGGDLDGGYLFPNILDGIQVCLSPGTSGNTVLENQLAKQYGIKCLLCDPEDEKKDIYLDPLNEFDQMALASTNTETSFTIDGWLSKYHLQDVSPLMMTMDIEGVEVDVINALPDSDLNKFRIISLELHYLHLLHTSDSPSYVAALFRAIDRLGKYFDCVHFKPNTTCPFSLKTSDATLHTLYTCVEVTYLHKQLRIQKPLCTHFNNLPHILDQPNSSDTQNADYSFYQGIYN